MFTTAAPHRTTNHVVPGAGRTAADLLRSLSDEQRELRHAPRACDTLHALADALAPQRVLVRRGDVLFQAGARCASLYILNGGIFRMTVSRPEAAEQEAGYRFRGDWLGLDGLACGRHRSTAIAIDAGEVWSLRLGALSVAGRLQPMLLAALRSAADVEQRRTLSPRLCGADSAAEIRIANFLLDWVESLVRQGRPADCIALRVSRADIGTCLGVFCNTLLHALAVLEQDGAIRYDDDSRREVVVVDRLATLAAFVARHGARATIQ